MEVLYVVILFLKLFFSGEEGSRFAFVRQSVYVVGLALCIRSRNFFCPKGVDPFMKYSSTYDLLFYLNFFGKISCTASKISLCPAACISCFCCWFPFIFFSSSLIYTCFHAILVYSILPINWLQPKMNLQTWDSPRADQLM